MRLVCEACKAEDPAARPSIARLIHVFRSFVPREAAAQRGLDFLLEVRALTPEAAYPTPATAVPPAQQQ
jgi:hypothetical protein